MAPDPIDAAASRLAAEGFAGPFACAIVTGTGLGALADRLDDRLTLPYRDIPGFPLPSVSGHGGRLHRGALGGSPILMFEGRVHAYERGDAAAMRVPIGAARRLGARALLLTSAAGSLDPAAGPGALVAVSDHINLSGLNPLIGAGEDRRFVPMVAAYDPALRSLLHEAADDCGIVLGEGVYAWFAGPSFETPAEIRMAGRLGADLVGMSIVPEVILARYYGLPVAVLSVVTNHAAGIAGGDPHHDETKDVAGTASAALAALVAGFVARLPRPEPE